MTNTRVKNVLSPPQKKILSPKFEIHGFIISAMSLAIKLWAQIKMVCHFLCSNFFLFDHISKHLNTEIALTKKKKKTSIFSLFSCCTALFVLTKCVIHFNSRILQYFAPPTSILERPDFQLPGRRRVWKMYSVCNSLPPMDWSVAF